MTLSQSAWQKFAQLNDVEAFCRFVGGFGDAAHVNELAE